MTAQARAAWDAALHEGRRTPEQKLLARFEQLKRAVAGGTFHRWIFLQSCGEFGDESHPIHLAALECKVASIASTRAMVMQLQVSRHDQLAHDIDLVCEGVLAKPHAKHDVTCIADAKRIMKLLIEANTCAMQGVNERPMH